MIFEEPGRAELKRATIAGYEPEKAARFGAHAGMDPARAVEALKAGADMPARMPRRLVMLLCLAALAGRRGACGEADVEQGVDEPAREGLAVELDGVDYNVFITRQLNTKIPPDNAYVDAGTEQGVGETLYGVFIQACNHSDETHLTTATSFKIVDNQGNEFEPEELPEDNQFAYHARELLPGRVHPGGRQRRPARPDGRLDAAVPPAAREHREPPARARDRGRGRRAPDVRAGYLASARRPARRAPPAPRSLRPLRLARASPRRRSADAAPARRR